MSYILEGLKKLEQKRQREGKSNLLTFQGENARASKRQPLWHYLIVVALLLNAAVIVWLMNPWRPSERRAAEQRPLVAGRTSGLTKVIPSDNRGQTPSGPVKEVQPSRPIQQSKALSGSEAHPAGKEAKELSRPLTAQVNAEGQTPALQSVSPSPQDHPKGKPSTGGRPARLSELPSDVMSGIPDLKMSVHYYNADSKLRFARINDKILHEGETLTEGIKVEEITSDGAILSYRGHRFQIGINENH